MDYEKLHKETINKLQQMVNSGKITVEVARRICSDFKPESEDERIRKEIVSAINIYCSEYHRGTKVRNDMLDWIEKQNKVLVTIDIDKMVKDYANNNEHGNEEFGKPVNCMIRAYRMGLTDALSILNFEKQGEKPQDKTAIEAIKEEKVDNANKIEPKDYSSIDPHFGKPIDKVEPKFNVGDKVYNIKNRFESTIESIDDTTYYCDTTNFDIKDQNNWELVEQKPAEEYSFNVKSELFQQLTKEQQGLWRKEIEQAYNAGKEASTEWSENDEQYLLVCKNALAKYQASDKWDATIISQWLENKLKSLRLQKQWKPSEEEMNALNDVISSRGIKYDVLSELWKDLKQL